MNFRFFNIITTGKLSIIIGDFNVPWNLPDQTDTQKLKILNTFNLLQEIEFLMYKADNTLV